MQRSLASCQLSRRLCLPTPSQNPYIEAWFYRRDHYETEFVWNCKARAGREPAWGCRRPAQRLAPGLTCSWPPILCLPSDRNTIEALWFLGGFTAGAYALSTFAFRHVRLRDAPQQAVISLARRTTPPPSRRPAYAAWPVVPFCHRPASSSRIYVRFVARTERQAQRLPQADHPGRRARHDPP
jgi:hypothetical protein